MEKELLSREAGTLFLKNIVIPAPECFRDWRESLFFFCHSNTFLAGISERIWFRVETSRNDGKSGVINNKSPTSMNLGFKRLKSQKLGFSLYQNNSHSDGLFGRNLRMKRFRAETSRNDRKGGVINNKSPTSMNLGFKRLKSQKLGFSLYNSHSDGLLVGISERTDSVQRHHGMTGKAVSLTTKAQLLWTWVLKG